MEKHVRESFSQDQSVSGSSDSSDLSRVIANEKGLLQARHFDHIQQIIVVYSKSLLAQMRVTHRSERQTLFSKQLWTDYLALSKQQNQAEVKVFNQATIAVLDEAKVKVHVWNQTIHLRLIQGENQMEQTACLTFYTPFIF